jgi:dipeptidyl aminopeptidase/acylaminoacyl peptidase
MKKIIIFSLIFLVIIISGSYYFYTHNYNLISPIGNQITKISKPLLVYTFDNLKNTKFPENNITLGNIVSDEKTIVSQKFYYKIPRLTDKSKSDLVSGLANFPKQKGVYPVIVMFRGFVPQEIFSPGVGSQRAAQVFAENGFITLAPDFLGYGESASPSADPFEDRFQAYVTALTLLSSLNTLNAGIDASFSGSIRADLSKIGIWGHSNGGHIALSTLAVSGVTYPTVLWAPVSKSFPYSILYYTDEADDQGKSFRKILAKFENDYNADLFSPLNYYNWIKAPLSIHQGEADREVPVWWSDDLVTNLKKENIDVKYFTYPGADHNLMPSGWSSAVQHSISFYNETFKK